jgi:hypothetical protein
VALTSPANNSTFTAASTIGLAANAGDTDGNVSSVSFYENGTLLGTDTTSPYTFNWTNVPAGSYSLTATATDNGGATTTSAPVTVTVSAAGRFNVALASNGATAVGSTTYSNGYSAAGSIDGDRKGLSWGNGGGWNDGTPDSWPDWLEVDFAGSKK